jgi:hypothetical protein
MKEVIDEIYKDIERYVEHLYNTKEIPFTEDNIKGKIKRKFNFDVEVKTIIENDLINVYFDGR